MFSLDDNTPYSGWDIESDDRSGAITLTFSENSDTNDWYDNYVYYHTSENYALLDSTFKIYLTEGNIYNLSSASYYDPFSLVIADKYGTALVSNEEDNDAASDADYEYDMLLGVIPDKSDWYYISASWFQGSYYKDCYLFITETISDENADDMPSDTDNTSPDTNVDTGSNTETNNNDSSHIIVQRGVVSAGSGDDDYIISPVLTDSNTSITITDGQGNNRIHLIDGLTITSSKVASNAIQLELSNGTDIK
ncbi:hypothetical protein [Oceanospirillum sediminis]|uniref:Uncharacterized protein n=1 Tax=Oceanospirillum sediminis TaxID=2760088 RepID=A0A839IXF2_9GAMM|nr:hypothetical protein [Oceanospirillum sediminis]MBB1489129.1 hypothetical protein [Oceanospirillum sediminis]